MHSTSVFETEFIAPTVETSKYSKCSEYITQTDIFSDVARFTRECSSHRDQLKAFIHTYSDTLNCLCHCENSLRKIDEKLSSEAVAPRLLVRSILELISGFVSAFSGPSLDEMKRMKTIVKEKIMSYDSDLRYRTREAELLKQSLDKSEGYHKKLLEELKRNHARSVDPVVNSNSFGWNPLKSDDKDKIFERIQRLSSDLNRVSSESELEFGELSNKHTSAYNRFSVIISELASIRRRMNRRMVSEMEALSSSLTKRLQIALEERIPSFAKSLALACISTGDFGMKLAPIEQSLSAYVGSDRQHRIHCMKGIPDLIEYRAIQTYLAKEEGELSFNRNDRIAVIHKDSSGWWKGKNQKGEEGIFPCVLISQRPAGASLPLQQKSCVSYRPNLEQTSMGTWRSTESQDNRSALINNYPGRIIGIVQFSYSSDGIVVEPGEIVEVLSNEPDKKFRVRNKLGIEGFIPMNFVNLKRMNDTNDQENISNVTNC